jgi:D,D-heptose 1,7-bisphosphate phosphatase
MTIKMNNNKLKQAVILCGGYGSRLGLLTTKTPKPLLKINNIPFLIYLIKNLIRYGISDILLLCHYRHREFTKVFKKNNFLGVRIRCIYEKKLLGSGGAILNIKDKLNKRFLVCNGDTYFDFNILDLFSSLKKKSIGIVALTKVKKDKERYNQFYLNKENKLLLSSHKNRKKNSSINSGFFIFNKDILNFLNYSEPSLENNIIPKLVKLGHIQGKVYCKSHHKFIDIGVKKDFVRANNFFSNVLCKKAVFLDRDGIINIDKGYVYKIKDFVWRKGIVNLIKYLNDNNYYVFVVTNQSGVGRGYYSEGQLNKLHIWINSELMLKGCHIDSFQYAPYFKNSIYKKYTLNKKFRKPNIGMYLEIKKKWNFDKNNSFMIGDKNSDLLFANKANLKGLLVNSNMDIFNKVKSFLNDKA